MAWMRIIFSRNRAAQLDLLLRSLARHAPEERTEIVWYATSDWYAAGYTFIHELGPGQMTPPEYFEPRVRYLLAQAADRKDTVTFFCDDDVVFRRLDTDPIEALEDDDVIAFSWRLSAPTPVGKWAWSALPRTDHGYPGSLDGHTFRAEDALGMLLGVPFMNPNHLETELMRGCEDYHIARPYLAAPLEQVLVSVPVNRVSPVSGCPHGERFPQSAEDLNARFIAGEHIDLDELDFSGVDSCHHEIQYVWR